MKNWFVLQIKAKQELVAKKNLANQGFNTFLPMMRVQKHTRGRWQAKSEPLFPGYLFIEIDLQHQNTSVLRSTRGVLALVRFGSEPRPFPETLLNELMQAGDAEGDVIDPTTYFEKGDNVELISGSLAGLSGIFKAKNSMERVVVMLNILGNETHVSVSPHQIAKVG